MNVRSKKIQGFSRACSEVGTPKVAKSYHDPLARYGGTAIDHEPLHSHKQ